MTGIELLAGAGVAYLIRKLRRVGERADADVDLALEAGMDAVHELVVERLGADRALETLVAEAGSGDGTVSKRTLRRVRDAVAAEAEGDPAFEERLRQLVEDLRAEEQQSGQYSAKIEQNADVSGSGRSYQAGRDMTVHERGSR
ncbi:chromosome partitioning protein [Kitasatospora sp. NA04385]|uniref:chromosome partitioning protein n=1 Tax=Kitasatospora sp. NA04385 TaxID=2742135 RepID=UPI0015913DDC|nr:chromosome partitioning protein [Kitasatospora sp. NA04385]QKW22466.1 chromosome partitioning protein [Kitasatospora sp. NA04385]